MPNPTIATATVAVPVLHGRSVTSTRTSPYSRIRFAACHASPGASAQAIDAYATTANAANAHRPTTTLLGPSSEGGAAITVTASRASAKSAAGYHIVGG